MNPDELINYLNDNAGAETLRMKAVWGLFDASPGYDAEATGIVMYERTAEGTRPSPFSSTGSLSSWRGLLPVLDCRSQGHTHPQLQIENSAGIR